MSVHCRGTTTLCVPEVVTSTSCSGTTVTQSCQYASTPTTPTKCAVSSGHLITYCWPLVATTIRYCIICVCECVLGYCTCTHGGTACIHTHTHTHTNACIPGEYNYGFIFSPIHLLCIHVYIRMFVYIPQLAIWSPSSPLPVQCYADHTAAIKAIAWSPHQHGILASGGGTADRTIRFRNTLTGQALQSIDTGSQVHSPDDHLPIDVAWACVLVSRTRPLPSAALDVSCTGDVIHVHLVL